PICWTRTWTQRLITNLSESFVLKMADPTAVFGNYVAVSAELVLVSGKPFDPHRASRVQFPVAYPYLCAEAVTVAIRKTCRSVVEYAGGVDFLQKTLGDRLIFRNNAIRVLRTVPVNVFQPLIHRIHNSYR